MAIKLNGTFYTPQEAAKECNLTPGRIHQMICDEMIKFIRVNSRCVLIGAKEVQRIKREVSHVGRPRGRTL